MDGIKNSMEEKFFFSNACHVCRVYGKDAKLKRCGGCQMIAYCSKEHQKEHWSEHKYFCQVISKFVNDAELKLKNKPYSGSIKDKWKISRKMIIHRTDAVIGRYLSVTEAQMIAHRRSCETCYEMDPQKLLDCTECPDASFCIEHPKDEKHSAKCEKVKLIFEYRNVTQNYKHTLPFCFCNDVPKNIDRVVRLYSLHCPMDKIFPTSKLWATFLSEQLTRPYTFLYSMKKLSRPKLYKMTIHVIGSNRMEMENVQLWQNLLQNDESLEELTIVFVGPELENNSFEIIYPDEDTKKKKARKIKIHCEGLMYEYFAMSRSFTKPDYVIGFNLGFGAFPLENDTWAPSIKLLAKLACPVFVTSYAAYEMKLDQDRIELFLDKNIKPLWCGENPFSGLLPMREYQIDGFSYNNHYLNIYEKLA